METGAAPPIPPPELSGTTILGKYELSHLLGRGSFAKVYKARSLVDGSTVAVKIIDKLKTVKPSMESRIVREVQAMSRLHHHPNIIKIYEVLATKTKIYLIIEFAAGGELCSKIERKGRLTERSARSYFQQLVSALCFCHQNGVAHRDIKPQNLLLDKDGNLKASDFGLSALPENLKNGLLRTACGTPAYIAPEILGRCNYDGSKADAWSCGIILYVMLAGRLPFDDSNIPTMFRKTRSRDYQFPEWISRPARHVIDQLLDPNPRTRMSLQALFENSWFKKSLKPELEMSVFGWGPDSCAKSDAGFNAFDIISMSSGLDLRGLFETTSGKRKEKRFTSNAKLNVVVERVKDIGGGLGFKVETGKNGSIGMWKGKVATVVEVNEIVRELLLVTVKVVEGGLDFEELYWKDLKAGLDDIVLSWHNDAL